MSAVAKKSYKPGDIVWTSLKYADKSEDKRRPAVVVSRDWVADARSDYIIAEISSSPYGNDSDVAIRGQEREQCRLRNDSFVRACKLFTVNEELLEATGASLTGGLLRKVRLKIYDIFFDVSPTLPSA